jgi:hypothetical protein
MHPGGAEEGVNFPCGEEFRPLLGSMKPEYLLCRALEGGSEPHRPVELPGLVGVLEGAADHLDHRAHAVGAVPLGQLVLECGEVLWVDAPDRPVLAQPSTSISIMER